MAPFVARPQGSPLTMELGPRLARGPKHGNGAAAAFAQAYFLQKLGVGLRRGARALRGLRVLGMGRDGARDEGHSEEKHALLELGIEHLRP